MRNYVANWAIRGLGKPGSALGAGETISLAPDQAAPLVACGALTEVPAPKPAPQPKPKAKGVE